MQSSEYEAPRPNTTTFADTPSLILCIIPTPEPGSGAPLIALLTRGSI